MSYIPKTYLVKDRFFLKKHAFPSNSQIPNRSPKISNSPVTSSKVLQKSPAPAHRISDSILPKIFKENLLKGLRRNVCNYSEEKTINSTRLSKRNFSVNKLKVTDERSQLIFHIQTFIKFQGVPPATNSSFYKMGRKLGRGAFGKVFQATHVLSNIEVAIKTIDKSYLQDDVRRLKINHEVSIMQKLRHRHIIRLIEVFETQQYFMIVLEYASKGDLLKLLKKKGKLTESETKPIFIQIVQALRACHKQQVVHRDVKLDNILLSRNFNVKLCDFGVSRCAKLHEKIFEQCGTHAYLAPEIIVNQGYDGTYADVWSLGVLLYTLLTGHLPFSANSLKELHKKILACQYEIPSFVSLDASDLISRLIRPVPFQRISLSDVFTHPWLMSVNKSHSSHRSSQIKKGVVFDQLEEFGFRKELVLHNLSAKNINHVTASYHVLDLYYSD